MKQRVACAATRNLGEIGLASFAAVAPGNSRNISNELQRASELIARSVRELREKRKNAQQRSADTQKNCGSTEMHVRSKYLILDKHVFEGSGEASLQTSSSQQFGVNRSAREGYRNEEVRWQPVKNAATYLPTMALAFDGQTRGVDREAGVSVAPGNYDLASSTSEQVVASHGNAIGCIKRKANDRCEINSVALQIAKLTEEIIKLRQARHGHTSIIDKERALVEKVAVQPKLNQLIDVAVTGPSCQEAAIAMKIAANTSFKEKETINSLQSAALQNIGVGLVGILSDSGLPQKDYRAKQSHKISTHRKTRASFVPDILSRGDMTSVFLRLAAILLLIGGAEGARRMVSSSAEQPILLEPAQKQPIPASATERSNHLPLINDLSKDTSLAIQSTVLAATSTSKSPDSSIPKKENDEWKQAFNRQLEHPESRTFEAALVAGNPRALFDKAIYFAEAGDDTSLAEAALLFSQAADKEFIPAQFRLGVAFEKGLGVPVNKVKAASMYSRAALGGNIKAMHNLATLLASGLPGSKPDYAQAAQWFLSAAERGFADSQYNYALLALRGTGMPRNSSDAFKYMSLAARQGDTHAAVRRDQIAQLLSKSEIESIERDIASFNVKMESAEANERTLPPSPWLENDWVTQRWFKKQERQG